MVRQHTWWQRLAAHGVACTAAAALGLLTLAMPPDAAALSVTGQGGAVPDNNATGVTFDFTIPPNAGSIACSGNNVALSLIGFTHGAAIDLTITLEHIGFGSAQFILDRVLNSESLVSSNNFVDGTYRFTSDATTTIRDIADIDRFANIPPGDYIPTLPDDATDSEMSSFWNGQGVSGTWRLFISDTALPFVSNDTWTWRLDMTLTGDDPNDDPDDDGIPNAVDNCLCVANPDQFDLDGDGLGDTCDPDGDNDGVPDNEDECPDSDLRATVVIDGCNSRAENDLFTDGCTISDLVTDCLEDSSNRIRALRCTTRLTKDLRRDGAIRVKEATKIVGCTVRSLFPRDEDR